MNDNVSPKQLKDLRNEFESYLRNSHPHGSSVNVCDAFFVFNNHIVDDFWGSFVSEDSMLAVRDKIETLLLKRNKPASALERANRYLSALRHLKAFLDLKHPEYITPNKAISVINNQPSCLTQTERNFSSNKDLYKSGADKTRYDINAPQNSDNQTQLHIAALNGNAEVTNQLIEAFADLNVEDVSGWTPLDIAVDKGHTDIVTALIKAGAYINNLDDKGRTLLHYAASNGHRDTVIALIKAGIDVNARDVWGWTPLDNAVDKGHAEVAIELIMADADIGSEDSDGWTLLHHAASKGQTDILFALIKAGIDINAENNDGKTSLVLALENGHLDLAMNLLEAKANIKTVGDKGESLLCYAASKGNSDVVIALIEAGVDLNASDNNGKTPLHFAAKNGCAEALMYLIVAGADLNAKDNNNLTPLDYAVKNGHTQIVETLIQTGANMNTEETNSTEHRRMTFLKWLSDHKTNMYTPEEIVICIDKTSEYAQKNGISEKIWDIIDPEIFEPVYSNLQKNKYLQTNEIGTYKVFLYGGKRYLEYLRNNAKRLENDDQVYPDTHFPTKTVSIDIRRDKMAIEVGKFTLESLTTGMYSEPESCYREYIQNAVDSLDAAKAEGIIKAEDCRIEIIVDGDRQEISIRDNGMGIKKDLVRKTLLDIGNSTKLHTTNRGFRGIGRLGGLSYCNKLSFCTSALGDNQKALITFDCKKLKELLVPGQNSEQNLQSVIEAVTEVQFMHEQPSAHYFIVKMEGVDDISSLLDLETVKDYISQVAPVPFRSKFYWGQEIKNKLVEKGVAVEEYPVFIGESFESLSQVCKPYKNSFETNSRGGTSKDEILCLSYFQINDSCQKIIAYGWYADTNFSGTLVDDRISGIRVRQGNMLIGNQRTLAPFFKESRFNGWAIGEVYVISSNLIPNARRDDFEKNNTYSEFVNGLRDTIGTDISNKIRAASKVRNDPIQKTLIKVESDVKNIEEVLKTGFHSSTEKGQVAAKLSTVKKELSAIPKNSPVNVIEQKKKLTERLTTLANEIDLSSNYKIKNDIPSNFSKSERKVIQAMMEVLSRNFERSTVDSLYREFLEELKK